jgi:ATP-dependent protease HslVU (ClpYQ) ATPase subunit
VHVTGIDVDKITWMPEPGVYIATVLLTAPTGIGKTFNNVHIDVRFAGNVDDPYSDIEASAFTEAVAVLKTMSEELESLSLDQVRAKLRVAP